MPHPEDTVNEADGEHALLDFSASMSYGDYLHLDEILGAVVDVGRHHGVQCGWEKGRRARC